MIPNNISEIPSGNTRNRSAAEAEVIAANVDFYRQVAAKYDSSEGYLLDPLLQQGIEEDLDKINSYFVSVGRTPSCLECGGGTGNLTLKMCARGWKVTVVDVSEDMLTALKEKALAKGFSPTLIAAPIERFLADTNETYDLVAFSAVLHHLYSYASVVERAVLNVCPGGFFYSNLDPVSAESGSSFCVHMSCSTALCSALVILLNTMHKAASTICKSSINCNEPVS